MIHHEYDEALFKKLCPVAISILERFLQTKQSDCCNSGYRQNHVLDNKKLLKDEDACDQEQSLVVVEERVGDELVIPLVKLCVWAVIPSSEIPLHKLMSILVQKSLHQSRVNGNKVQQDVWKSCIDSWFLIGKRTVHDVDKAAEDNQIERVLDQGNWPVPKGHLQNLSPQFIQWREAALKQLYQEECEQHDGVQTHDYKEGAQTGQKPDRVDSENSFVLLKLFVKRPDVFKLDKHLFEDLFCLNKLERVYLEQDAVDSLSTCWQCNLEEWH